MIKKKTVSIFQVCGRQKREREKVRKRERQKEACGLWYIVYG